LVIVVVVVGRNAVTTDKLLSSDVVTDPVQATVQSHGA